MFTYTPLCETFKVYKHVHQNCDVLLTEVAALADALTYAAMRAKGGIVVKCTKSERSDGWIQNQSTVVGCIEHDGQRACRNCRFINSCHD